MLGHCNVSFIIQSSTLYAQHVFMWQINFVIVFLKGFPWENKPIQWLGIAFKIWKDFVCFPLSSLEYVKKKLQKHVRNENLTGEYNNLGVLKYSSSWEQKPKCWMSENGKWCRIEKRGLLGTSCFLLKFKEDFID